MSDSLKPAAAGPAAEEVHTDLATRARAFLAVSSLELLLTVRGKRYWVMQAVLAVPVLLTLLSASGSGTYLRYAAEQLRQLIALWLLVLPLLAFPTFRRTRGARGDLTFATPLSSTAHGLASLLGVLGWLLPLAALQLALRWVAGAQLGGQGNWALLTAGPGLFLSVSVLGLGLFACLRLLFERALPALLVWLGLWVLALMASGGVLGGFLGGKFPLLSLGNVFFDGLVLSPAAGLGLVRGLALGLACSFALVGAALLAAWLLLVPVTDGRRRDRTVLTPVAVFVLAVAGAVVGLAGYGAELARQDPPRTPLETQVDEWRVLRSDLAVTFAPDSSPAIAGTTALTLRATPKAPGDAPPEVIVLRLRPGIEIITATTQGGEPLVVRRDGDSVMVFASTSASTPVGSLLDPLDGTVTLELAFAGDPVWPYSDTRLQVGGSFPAFDSSQPLTSLLVNGAGFLLRDGDWRPWPWSTASQLAEESDNVSVTAQFRDGPTAAVSYAQDPPQLLAVAAPRWEVRAGEDGSLTTALGKDPGAGLERVARSVAAAAPTIWGLLGEDAPERVTALPYVSDVYANASAVLIPEANDLAQATQVGTIFAGHAEGEVLERVALQLAARAWLNGNSRAPRAYARATGYTTSIHESFRQTAIGAAPTEQRLMQVVPVAALGYPWSDSWIGVDPNDFDVTPWALWLGMEAAAPEVRRADLTLLREVARGQANILSLRDRGLPWDFSRKTDQVRLVLALSEWAELVGREEAVRAFGEAYRTVASQDHATVVEALGLATGVQVDWSRGTGGEIGGTR